MRATVLALTAILAISLNVQAQTFTWNVAGDGAWKDANNWDPSSGYPLGSGDTAILTGGHTVTYEQASGSSTLAALITGTGNVTFDGSGTVAFSNNANTFTGAVSIAGVTLDIAGGQDGRFGYASNSVTIRDNGEIRLNNATWNPPASRVVSVDAGDGRLYSHGGGFTFNDVDQLQGSGLLHVTTGNYGTHVNSSQPQPNFSGGFDVLNADRRQTDLTGSATGSLGSGPVTGSGQLRVNYAWGAQDAGGAVDGGKVGVEVRNSATVNLTGGAGSTAGDRFTILADGALRGSSSLLPEVSRVTAFTPGGGTGAEAILHEDAVIVHTTGANATTISSPGTDADLLFGLGANFNNAAFALAIGAGTPWKGFSKDSYGDAATSFRLQQGTISVDDGGGTFAEMAIRSTGRDYSGNSRILYLGNGADSPVFTAVNDPVPARVMMTTINGYMQGEVYLDSTAPAFAGGISRWIVGGPVPGRLIANRANSFDGIPVDIEHEGYLRHQNSAASTVGALSYNGNTTVELTAGSSITAGSLSAEGPGLLRITPTAGRNALGDTAWLKVTGYPAGNAADDAVIVNDTDLERPELATYDATDGFKVASYDTTDINTAVKGDFAKITGSDPTLTTDRALLGLVLGRRLLGTGQTLTVGLKDDDTHAAYGMVLGHRDGTARVDPDLNFGDSEGVLFFRYGASWSAKFDIYGALIGNNGLTISSSGSTDRITQIRNAANAIAGTVTLLTGITDITAGNGFAGSDLAVARGATMRQLVAAQSINGLTGSGRINLGAGRTLTVNGDFKPGDAYGSPLSVGTAGTLALAGSAVLACDLDGLTSDKSRPLAVLGDADLTIASGASIRVDSIANVEELIGEPFALLSANSITGAFESVETPAGSGLVGSVTIDSSGPVHTVSVTLQPPPGTLFLLR